MNYDALIKIHNIEERYNGFLYLDIPILCIPKGFSIALIGENGAGKSSLLRIIAGIQRNYNGQINYFCNEKSERNIRNSIGYVSSNNFFLDTWTIKSFGVSCGLLYDNFSMDKYNQLLEELGFTDTKQLISSLSDGMKMKVALASVLARDTKLLLLDEPSSPLDPLMRDKLRSIIQEYIADGNGERTVIFSTHDVADMESITDYAIILSYGNIVDYGTVDELKEKYTVDGNIPTLAQLSIDSIKENRHPLLNS